MNTYKLTASEEGSYARRERRVQSSSIPVSYFTRFRKRLGKELGESVRAQLLVGFTIAGLIVWWQVRLGVIKGPEVPANIRSFLLPYLLVFVAFALYHLCRTAYLLDREAGQEIGGLRREISTLKLARDDSQAEIERLKRSPEGPEMWLSFEGMQIGERVLRITNVAGGTARDIQLQEMTDGELTSDKGEVIPFLAVGLWSIVKPRVRMADEGWRDITSFTLDSFFMKAKKPIIATIKHLDANGASYTTVFQITPVPNTLQVEIKQVDRRRD
jgi:hypothetical protein